MTKSHCFSIDNHQQTRRKVRQAYSHLQQSQRKEDTQEQIQTGKQTFSTVNTLNL